MFPGARVIHCRRDRRDTAVSIWSQLFAHQDLDYAYDLGEIAAFAEGHDRLMRHWQQSLRLPVFELHYEELVAQPQAVLDRLHRFLGAEPPAAAVRAAPASAISTASIWQARQPVYRSAVGRWRDYAPHLPELLRHFPGEDGAI